MAASVRIDGEAFTDPRLEVLGSIAGYNRHEALGRLALLWATCTDRETKILAESFVIGCLGPKGVEALLQAGLGEKNCAGIRIKGTEGRIEWLAKRRAAAKTGGDGNAQRVKNTKTAPESGKGASESGDTTVGERQGSAKTAVGEPNESKMEPSDSQTGANREPSDSQTGANREPSFSSSSSSSNTNTKTFPQVEPNRSQTGAKQEPSFSPEQIATLTAEFLNAPYRGPRLTLDRLHEDCRNAFTSLGEMGFKFDAVLGEIKRSDRDKKEWVHKLAERMSKEKEKSNGKQKDRKRYDPLLDAGK